MQFDAEDENWVLVIYGIFCAPPPRPPVPMTSFSFAAKLAFLVFGPMMDIKLLFMYAAVFQRKVVAALFIGLFIVIALLAKPWAQLTEKVLTVPAAPAALAQPSAP